MNVEGWAAAALPDECAAGPCRNARRPPFLPAL